MEVYRKQNAMMATLHFAVVHIVVKFHANSYIVQKHNVAVRLIEFTLNFILPIQRKL